MQANYVANTILSQIGGNKFLAMTGAKNLVSKPNGLSMRIGRNKTNSNYLKIRLNSLDLYDMVFAQIQWSGTVKSMKEYKNIDAENLQRVFTSHTGMYTSL